MNQILQKNARLSKINFWKQLILFISIYFMILFSRKYIINIMIHNGSNSFQNHAILSIICNVIAILVSYNFMKTNGLLIDAGLKGRFFTNLKWLIFPFFYLVSLNLLFSDKFDNNNFTLSNILLLLFYTLSIGFAEELSMRGFIQSFTLNRFGNSKKSIFWTILSVSLFFGLLHLLKFNNGIYGELSQLIYATFIGFMFGSILLITKKIYPLAIVHTIIDFASKLDSIGNPIHAEMVKETSLISSIMTVLFVLPCFIYGLLIFKKIKYEV